jgi:DNA helicase-2/ATP-dependent DNA helicase PcrA
VQLLRRLGDPSTPWVGQLGQIRLWYEPYLEELYEMTPARKADLEELEAISGTFESRERFLSEITLDPPEATGDRAGPPLLDEDYLILSTIHSAKGREWRIVYILNVVDGCIPSDMACGSTDEIEEERRLLYVAMTRARDELHLIHPKRFYTHNQARNGDRHVYAPRSRFLPQEILGHFDLGIPGSVLHGEGGMTSVPTERSGVDIAAELREMW